MRSLTLFCLFCLSAFAGPHRHHEAHVHGSAKLQITTENSQLFIYFEAPAHDVLGFEHKPKSSEQKKKLLQAIAKLKKTNEMFELSEGAECVALKEAQIESELIDKEKHDHHHSEHFDFKVSYTFNCQKLNSLNSFRFLGFSKFTNLRTIKAVAVTNGGQFSAKLTAKNPKFVLKK